MSDDTRIAAATDQQTLTMLCASALRSAISACAQKFHASDGVGFDIAWCTSGALEQRIVAGERFDLAGGARDALDLLVARASMTDTVVNIGAAQLALGVREGDCAPDVSSLDTFKAAMLAAQSIARGDPAGGGTAGKHLVRVFEQMGILEMVQAKSVLRAGGFKVMSEVAQGHADFGLTQSTEIPAVPGVRIGAFLPQDIQMRTVYAMGLCHGAQQAAHAFMDFLASPDAAGCFSGAGFAPP